MEFTIHDPVGEKSLAHTGRIFSPADGLELERLDELRVRIVGYGRSRNAFSLVFERTSTTKYRLVAIERTRHARVEVVYDLHGRPSHLVQRREGRSYELVHEGDRVVEVRLHLPDRSTRTVVRYVYDARRRLIQAEDERGQIAAYAYDDADRVVHDEKRGGSVYTVRYGRDGRCDYAAGVNGYQERSLRYDRDGRRTWVEDSHGKTTLYEWNDHGQVIRTTTPSGTVTTAQFDEDGRPILETGPNGSLRAFVYDAHGRVAIERRSGGVETTYQYDDAHRPVLVTEAVDGEPVARSSLAYDDDHNLTRTQQNDRPPWQYEWTPFGELALATNPSGASARRHYDVHGNLVRVTNWEGHAWTFTHDAHGRALTETDPLGHVWRVEYLDGSGQSVRVLAPDGRLYAREVSTDERSILHSLPGGRSRVVELSFCGKPIRIQDEEGAETRLRWGTEPDELLAITNANGVDYTFAYDADMRLVERRTFDGRILGTEWQADRIAASYDSAGRRTAFEYDVRGHLTKQTNDDGETKLRYDKRGLLARIETPSSVTELWRDDLGRVIAEEQDGVRLTRELDVMGRPTTHATPFGLDTSFEWSASGNLTALRYGDVSIDFERDALGRETKRRLGDAGVFEQAYDSVGRLVAQSFQSTSSSLGAPRGVMRHFGFDERGFLASIEDSLRGHTRLMHSARGDLTGVVRQHGSSDFYLYDGCRNRVYHAATQHGAALATALDRVARERATSGDTPVDLVAARFPHEAQSFGYALGDRVVVVTRPDSQIELTYDVHGQVTSKAILRGVDRATWKYQWNARGELATLTTPNGKTWSYRYDGMGRRIEKRSPTGDTWRYVWSGSVLLHTLKNGSRAETYIHEPGGPCPLLRDDGDVHFILPDQNDSPCEEIGRDGKLEWAAKKGTWGEGFTAHGASGGEPFLGQWYDAESGLHYNYFRYYDPDTGRYLSPDPIDLVGGLNAFLATSAPFSNYDRFGLCNEEEEGDPPQPPAKQLPNLYPEDTPKRTGSFRLELRDGKWVTVSSSGDVFSASGRYNFVVQNGEIIVGRTGAALGSRVPPGHIDLARGAPVDYAGEIQFSGTGNRGQLRWWSNASGHYQPPAESASQAGLPLQLFRPFL